MTFEILLLTSLQTQFAGYLGIPSGTEAFTREIKIEHRTILPAFDCGFRFRLSDAQNTGLNASLAQVDTNLTFLFLDFCVHMDSTTWSDFNDSICLFFRKPPFNLYTPPAPDPSSPYKINSVVIWKSDPPQYDHPQGFPIRRYYLACNWQYV